MEENSKLESLEEMLNELDTGVSANSDTIKSTDNSDILEADVDVNIVKDSNITFREKVINKLKDYEDITNSQAKLEVEKEEVMNSIKKACPELFDRISKLDNEILAKDNQIDEMKKSITPLFEKAIKESSDNKTLLYGKVQGTYVDSTKKHSFDLKSFIDENKDFYTNNISIFDPYSKITDVAAYTKITVKKK